MKWAEHVFGQADLGDARRTQRLVHVAAILAAKPLSSFCQAYQTWPETKAAYRFIENDSITASQLELPSREAALKACQGQKIVLAVSDTSSLNFTNHRATQGLGPISEAHLQGLLFHSTLMLSELGVPLGLFSQKQWIRDAAEHGKAKNRKHKKIQDKESFRWVQNIQESSLDMDTLPEETRPHVIHVFDREGDIYEVFQALQDTDDGAVIRSSWNRKTQNPHGHLHNLVLASPSCGRQTIDVPRKQGERKRKALVVYRAIPVTLEPPLRLRSQLSLTLNMVAVTEIKAPIGVEPLQWFLLTTQPIDSFQDILNIVRIYKLRWRIEEYHLILKSGCRIEKIQFETADRIKKLLMILAAVALRLLQLTYMARIHPHLPCTHVLNKNEWRALQTHIQGKPPPQKAKPPSLQQAMLWIGRLGGHLGRKSDGMPGVRSIWRGWRDLQLITVMFIACQTQTNSH